MKTFEVSDKEVIVDEQDVYLLKGIKWYLMKANQLTEKYYVITQMGGETVYLHRLIMGNPSGIVDHINRDTLDCRRTNLRITTQSINRLNCEVRQNKKSSTSKGVFFDKRRKAKPYYSMIQLKDKKIWLGSFATEKEAWQAYNAKLAEILPELLKAS